MQNIFSSNILKCSAVVSVTGGFPRTGFESWPWNNRSLSRQFRVKFPCSILTDSVAVGSIPSSLRRVTALPDGSRPFMNTDCEWFNNETADMIIGSFPFKLSHLDVAWVVGASAHCRFINVTLHLSWPEVSQRQERDAGLVCVNTFSARASSSVPSAVSVFEVSVCKDLTLSFRPLSCFSLSLSWSCRFSIYRQK